jgi:hypothetical protein
MDFRTIVEIQKQEPGISYSNKIMMLGSCFTENIGKKLEEAKFQLLINPFGILYNPDSIYNSLSRIIEKKIVTREELFAQEGSWKSYSHHSRFSELTPEKFLEKANTSLTEAFTFLRNTDFLFITFGTTWIYRLKKSGDVVSNCHKMPASLFNREKLEEVDIVEKYSELIDKIIQLNPAIKIVFTVSPIRHWKDGAHENQLSKATLLLSVDRLKNKYPDLVIYFPAYEIVLDELRDYRFYAADMQHPNEIAINYIWERFTHCFFSTETVAIKKDIEKIISAAKHRPFNPESAAFQQFVNQNIHYIDVIEHKYPNLNFDKERAYFNMNQEP